MSIRRVKLVCERGPEPLDGVILDYEEEIVDVKADTLWEAFERAAMRTTLNVAGRPLRGYDWETGQDILPPPLPCFRRSRFMVEEATGPHEGYTRDETWNGWAVPYFDAEVAHHIVSDVAHLGVAAVDQGASSIRYDTERDAFVYRNPVSAEEVAWDATTIRMNGESFKAYPIGYCEWTWEEAAQRVSP